MLAIRRLLPADAPALRRLRLESLRRDPDAFLATVAEDEQRDVAWFAERLSDPDPACCVMGAFADDRVVGMVGSIRGPRARARHRVSLWGMWVAPEARGQRIGRALVEEMLAHLRTLGNVERVYLSVTGGQNAARALYESLGFARYGTDSRAFKDGARYLAEELMARDL